MNQMGGRCERNVATIFAKTTRGSAWSGDGLPRGSTAVKCGWTKGKSVHGIPKLIDASY